jgi:hypothetical protein
MIYAIDINTEKLTYTKSNPQKTVLKLDYGTIHQLDIEFPSGCSGLTGVQIKRGLHQVYPSNPGGYFTGDGTKISFKENYLLDSAPFELDIWTWNDDTAWDHRVFIRIGLLRQYLGKKFTSFDELISSS